VIDLNTTQMTRAGGVGHSSAADPHEAGREALLAATGAAQPAAGDLVVLFASVRYDLTELHAAVAELAAPAAIVGASTAGAFADSVSVERGCVVAFLPGDGLSLGISHVAWDTGDPAASARLAADTARVRAGEERPHSTLLLFTDAIGRNGRDFARGTYDATSALVPLVGAVAADDYEVRETWTFGEGVARPDGVVAVWIDSDKPIGVGSAHGFRPVGCAHVVTRTDGRLVLELDNRPALDVYLGELGGHLPRSVAAEPHHIPSHPLGALTPSGLHQLHSVGLAGEALQSRMEIAEGTIVEVMATDARGLVDGARRAAAEAVAQLAAPARLALAFGGVDRVALLGGSDDAQVAGLLDGAGGAPLAGFNAYGQFARRIGPGGFHTSSVCVLAI
jgi:hypothetical protein